LWNLYCQHATELAENKIMAGADINRKIKIFTEHEIKRMTRNYSTAIGKGGFGEVYRGLLDDSHDLVAVKRYIRGDLRKRVYGRSAYP